MEDTTYRCLARIDHIGGLLYSSGRLFDWSKKKVSTWTSCEWTHTIFAVIIEARQSIASTIILLLASCKMATLSFEYCESIATKNIAAAFAHDQNAEDGKRQSRCPKSLTLQAFYSQNLTAFKTFFA